MRIQVKKNVQLALADMDKKGGNLKDSTLEFAKALKVYALLHDGKIPKQLFKVEPNDPTWPPEFKEGYNLGSHLNNWRIKYKSKEMQLKDIEFFKKHDVHWRSERKYDKYWIQTLAEALRSYHRKNHPDPLSSSKRVVDGYPLGRNINKARYSRRQDKLTQDQINELTDAGIDWGKKKY